MKRKVFTSIKSRRLLSLLKERWGVRLFLFFTLASCSPEPPLHLYDAEEVTLDLPIIDLDLKVYWDYQLDYEMGYDVTYDWRSEWYYGWDEEDYRLWGDIGYTEPTVFNLRRYYTANEPYAPHTGVISNTVEGTHFQGRYDWGFWDILVWNRVYSIDGVQSLHFDEESSLDSVTAYTNQSMNVSRYHAPRYTHSFYPPEPLYGAYEQAIEIERDLKGFVYDPERDVWVRTLNMTLRPVTYIYLTQVILHHNKGRITAVDGNANFSGFARSTTVNNGQAGNDAVTVYYSCRMKKNIPYRGRYGARESTEIVEATRGSEEKDFFELVDIAGGRLMTFGICGIKANNIKDASEVRDANRHYMDVTMQFNNGTDSTFVFDVTDQVRQRWKGGVITVELDVDNVPIPSRSGGSGFYAVVKDYEDGGTHEFDM